MRNFLIVCVALVGLLTPFAMAATAEKEKTVILPEPHLVAIPGFQGRFVVLDNMTGKMFLYRVAPSLNHIELETVHNFHEDLLKYGR